MTTIIDEKDRRILDVLIENSDLSIQKISKKTGIPITTVHNRIKKLKKSGVIRNYTVKLDHQKLGKNVLSYVLVNVDQKTMSQSDLNHDDILRILRKHPACEEASLITGAADILLKVRFGDLDKLTDYVVRELRSTDANISNSQTLVVLRSI